jgi:hypothetical protein
MADFHWTRCEHHILESLLTLRLLIPSFQENKYGDRASLWDAEHTNAIQSGVLKQFDRFLKKKQLLSW